MTQTEALRLALEALEYTGLKWPQVDQAITAIKAALEAKDEPVAWMDASRFEELRNGFTVMTTLTKKKAFFDDIAIYTTPPQRMWVGLTRTELIKCGVLPFGLSYELYESIEAKLRSKNGY